MKRTKRHDIAWLALAICPGLLAGCVDRRFVITSDPPGAVVYDEKNQPMGMDRQFTYYGKYRFTLVKDGYETMTVLENVRAPWYEWPGIDLVSEIILPLNLRDVRRYHYVMQPVKMVPPEDVLNEATQLRTKGKSVGSPLPPKFPEAEAPPPRVLPAPPTGAVVPPGALPAAPGTPAPPSPAVPQLGAPSPRT